MLLAVKSVKCDWFYLIRLLFVKLVGLICLLFICFVGVINISLSEAWFVVVLNVCQQLSESSDRFLRNTDVVRL